MSVKIRMQRGLNARLTIYLFIPRNSGIMGCASEKVKVCLAIPICFKQFGAKGRTRPEYRHEPAERWLASPQLELDSLIVLRTSRDP